jgi:hypothetical protein
MSSADYFIHGYTAIRAPHAPMKWMERMFAEIVAGKPRGLVDLPTGTGKTELVAIWLLALAWYGRARLPAATDRPSEPRQSVAGLRWFGQSLVFGNTRCD